LFFKKENICILGLDRVGIYRLSGVQSKVNRLQLEFMYGNE